MISGQDRDRLGRLVLFPILVAFILRLLWGISIPIVPVSDSHAYDVFAQHIAQGVGYGWEPNQPTAYWPVGTSAIYGFFFWLFGHRYAPIMLFQVFVGVGVVALAMSVACRWFGQTVALTTGWILACWPLLIQYTTILASELFFVFFLLVAFWLSSISSRRWIVTAACSGIALAAASYVRPLALVMAPFLFIKNGMEKRQWRVAFLACLVAVVAMSACILPWTVRNWHAFDRLVLISTNGGSNLWMGNNPKSDTGYMEEPRLDIPNEADRDRYLGQQAKEYIAQNPTAFLVRAFRKTISLYDRESIGVSWNEKGIVQRFGESALPGLKLISSVYWWATLAVAICGVFALTRSSGLSLMLLCPPITTWAYFTLVHIVTVAADRYHVPSIPFIAMVAAVGLSSLWTTRTGGRHLHRK